LPAACHRESRADAGFIVRLCVFQLDLLLVLIDPILKMLCMTAADGSLCAKQAAKVCGLHCQRASGCC
jgi:hypothetical protein